MNHPALHLLSKYWVWGLAVVGVLCLVFLITSVGLLLSFACTKGVT